MAKEEAVLAALPLGCARDALEEGECFAALGEAEGLLVGIGETMEVNEGEGVEDWQEDAVEETEEEGELRGETLGEGVREGLSEAWGDAEGEGVKEGLFEGLREPEKEGSRGEKVARGLRVPPPLEAVLAGLNEGLEERVGTLREGEGALGEEVGPKAMVGEEEEVNWGEGVKSLALALTLLVEELLMVFECEAEGEAPPAKREGVEDAQGEAGPLVALTAPGVAVPATRGGSESVGCMGEGEGGGVLEAEVVGEPTPS